MIRPHILQRWLLDLIATVLSAPILVIGISAFVAPESESMGSLTGFHEILSPTRLSEIASVAKRAVLLATLVSTLSFCTSYLLFRFTSPTFQIFFLLVITLPFLVNEAVRIFSLKYFLSEHGLLNSLLSQVLSNETVVSDASNNLNIFWAMFLTCFPFGIFINIAGLKMIPSIYWATAKDLRMTEASKFIRIALPLAGIPLTISFIVVFLVAFSLSSEVNFLGGDTKLSIRNLVTSLLSAGQYQAVFALGALLIALFIALFLLLKLIGHKRR